MIVQASNKKTYAIEQRNVLRVMSSGIRLTDAVISMMKLKVGQGKDKPGDTINYAHDPENGKVYICKSDVGNAIGEKKIFTSTGLKNALIKLAEGASITNDGKPTGSTVSEKTQIKGGLQLRFEVSKTPVTQDEVDYYELTFESASIEKEREGAEEEVSEKSAKEDF